MKCKHRNRVNDVNFCLTACSYCTFQQEAECEMKHPEYFGKKLEESVAKDGECNCLETDDKYEYWGYWNVCECGFNNIEGAKYCGGCGKKINVIGVTEDYIKW